MADLLMPVTVVMSRRAAPDRAGELVAWAESLCEVASAFPGHLGHKVHEAPTDTATQVIIGLSFATSADLVRWEQSAERAAALDTGAELTEGSPTSLAVQMMDAQVWGGVERSPSARWRSAAIVWAGLFPPAVLTNLLLEPFAGGWPLALRTFVLTVILVPVVVLGTVPLINRALRTFCARQASRRSTQEDPGHAG